MLKKNNDRQEYKKLSMYLTKEMHKRVKEAAARRDITITRLVSRAIYKFLQDHDKFE